MQAERWGTPHRDWNVVAVIAQHASLKQPRIDVCGLREVAKETRQFHDLSVWKATGRERRHDESDVSDAIQHHLSLLRRRAAERTVRIQLDLNGAAGRFVHGGGEWLLD